MNFLWGNSVALSWMWGLGLFFSVQFSLQYGLFGLLTFAIPNALGLMIFGGLTQVIARRAGNGPDALGAFFANWSRPYRLIFFLYQILAITLTIFALVRYAWQPLGLEPAGLYLLLTVLIILAAATLFGEEFDIRRIKYSHGVLGMIALGAMLVLFWQLRKIGSSRPMITGSNPFFGMNFWGYAIPICVGLTLGPWLDLQQWQRAIQIQREGKSPALSYLFGGALFFLLLLAHGGLALWVAGQTGGPLMREGIDGLVLWFFWIYLPVKKAKTIIAISNHTKNEIVRVTGCNPLKIIVIPCLISSHFKFFPKKFNKNCPVILHVGTAWNKNLDSHIKALKGISCQFNIVGLLTESQKKDLFHAGIRYQNFAQLSEMEMLGFYHSCDLLLFASLTEGFGLPILEAQSVGRVVITSRGGATEEVAGNGAVLVDPLSPEDIHKGILSVINNESLRVHYISEGIKNKNKYIFQSIIDQHDKILSTF